MSITDKPMSPRDAEQATRASYNDVNATIGVDGFLVGKVGRKVTQTISTTTIANDTATFNFLEGATLLYSIRLIFTDGGRTELLSAERIA